MIAEWLRPSPAGFLSIFLLLGFDKNPAGDGLKHSAIINKVTTVVVGTAPVAV